MKNTNISIQQCLAIHRTVEDAQAREHSYTDYAFSVNLCLLFGIEYLIMFVVVVVRSVVIGFLFFLHSFARLFAWKFIQVFPLLLVKWCAFFSLSLLRMRKVELSFSLTFCSKEQRDRASSKCTQNCSKLTSFYDFSAFVRWMIVKLCNNVINRP